MVVHRASHFGEFVEEIVDEVETLKEALEDRADLVADGYEVWIYENFNVSS